MRRPTAFLSVIRPNGRQRRKDAEARHNRGLPCNAGKFRQTIEDVKAASRLEHKGAREFLAKEGVLVTFG